MRIKLARATAHSLPSARQTNSQTTQQVTATTISQRQTANSQQHPTHTYVPPTIHPALTIHINASSGDINNPRQPPNNSLNTGPTHLSVNIQSPSNFVPTPIKIPTVGPISAANPTTAAITPLPNPASTMPTVRPNLFLLPKQHPNTRLPRFWL
ncbi:hypothetical protein VTI74DRAFT_1171 [Chaetomium olivicolor]